MPSSTRFRVCLASVVFSSALLAATNPLFPGADPHVVVAQDRVWLYPTWSEPRGSENFFAYSSTNLMNWERHGPILEFRYIPWIPTDGQSRHGAWAPAVIEHHGKWYFYYSVGPQNPTPSRLGVAVGDSPAGPFVDSGQPLLTGGAGFEAIDPMVFADPKSGKTYLYAGGSAGAKLRIFELGTDLTRLGPEVPTETPSQFTEGVFLHERQGTYYLSYSHGNWQRSSYSVHYATGPSPIGPWSYRGAILTSDATRKGPGHHSFFRPPGSDAWWIAYHRWENQTGDGPYPGTRQVCLDRVEYDAQGLIQPIVMTGGAAATTTGASSGTPPNPTPLALAPLGLGNQLELLTDGRLVERLEGCRLKLHEPHAANVALRFDAPWEGSFSGYVTVLHDGDRFRCYYRGSPIVGRDGSDTEVTCYAESRDGVTFTKPALGLFEVHGTRSNNVVLASQAPFSHNFAPFLDARPGVPSAERFKALAGTSEKGLFGFVSDDGWHWRKIQDRPLLTEGAFDSQNVAFWSTAENAYVLYLRTWSQGEFRGYRTISRSVSTNFLNWSKPVEMDFGNAPREHLYTSQTHPYFRAPHLYIATPMRFLPGRQVLTPEQARALGVDPGYASDVAEAVLMTSRGGTHYDRTFLESFIRPGPDLGNWASRAGLSALGIVPTGPAEMSLYKQAHYAQPSAHLVRYTLRTDGFVSVNAPYAGGEWITRPLTFTGRELVVNFSTGAAGRLRVELQDAAGKPLPGFSLAEAREQIGDEIERVISWKVGRDVSAWAGQAVRLRFVMQDADVYSVQFR